MDLTTAAWLAIPWLFLLITVFLLAINVFLWRLDRRRDKSARRRATRSHSMAVLHANAKGYQRGFESGKKQGAEDAFTQNETFIQCPECDHAVHVPLLAIIDGEPGQQAIRAEADTTALWLHMESHTGKIHADGLGGA